MDERRPKDPGLEALQADASWHVVLPSGRVAKVVSLAGIDKTPYRQGYKAVGSQDADCPYPDGSRDHAEWWDGFRNAMADHWYYDDEP